MKESKIEWTDHTHNEWIGCEKISDGCKHCYAEELMDKRYARAKWGANGTRTLTSIQNRNKPFSWNRKAEKEGVRYKVFAQSLSDTFEDREELEPWRIELFEKIASTPNLDWLVLTKRPEVANRFFVKYSKFCNLSNLWLGVSIENQKAAEQRIPILLDIPAKVKFSSIEPLLGEVDLTAIGVTGEDNTVHINSLKGELHTDYEYGCSYESIDKIDWVIVGGESGNNARPMHPDWVRSIRDQCQEAGVPFFFKQWGEWMPQIDLPSEIQLSSHGFKRDKIQKFEDQDLSESPWMVRIGKKKAGSLLDGREWKEFPK